LDIHLSQHPLDDEISRRGLGLFIERLDRLKMYFLRSDIERFQQSRNDLDDMLSRGDVNFAHEVFTIFLHRLDERFAQVEKIIDADHDFNIEEEMVKDPDDLDYSATEEEVVERWRKRIKYDLLILKSDGVDIEDARERLHRRYGGLKKRMHQFDNEELLEIYLSSISAAFDPHTSYMSPDSLTSFDIEMRLGLEGIGAQLTFRDGYTVVTKIIRGGAADKEGKLKSEDRIIGVAQGLEGEIEDVVDMSLTDVVKKIRGTPGTVVRLQVIPEGSNDAEVYTITRAKIELKDKEAQQKIYEVGQKPDGTSFRVGVLNLPSFYRDFEGAQRHRPNFRSMTRDAKGILADFRAKGVDAVIVDLRFNGGGALPEAVDFTGLFIDRGPVVQVKDFQHRIEDHEDNESGMEWNGPLVVLVNKFSASASEIFAGAIQDYNRGLIVGDRTTHGKGTVQTMLDIGGTLFRGLSKTPKMGALKLTIQQFYLPGGSSTQLHGVASDITLPALTDYLPVGESDLDFPFKWNQVPAARFSKTGWVNGPLVKLLKQRSQQRLSTSEEFQKDEKNIERYRELKAEKTVTLNEEKFLAQREELDSEKEEKEQYEQLTGSDDELIERDYYMNEALAITVDYIRSLQDSHLVQTN